MKAIIEGLEFTRAQLAALDGKNPKQYAAAILQAMHNVQRIETKP